MEDQQSYTILGSGKPLVFQHGLGANAQQIISLLDELQGVRLLTMDMPGHGHNKLDPSRPPSFNSYTDELIRIMDKAGIDRAAAGGLSMGSGIALNMAWRYPERVAGLILLRPAWHLSSHPKNLEVLLEVARLLNKGEDEKLSAIPRVATMRREIPAAADSIMGLLNREQKEDTPEVLQRMVADKPLPGEPTDIMFPALVIGNDDDPLHPWEMAEAWHKLLPNSKLLKVPSRYTNPTGHKAEVTHAIQDFMNTITFN